MKLIVTIIDDSNSEPVSNALITAEFRVTRIASTGGFLRRGLSTLMIGVADEKVAEAIQIIKDNVGPPADPIMKRATLFVLDVENFTQV